MRILGFMTGTSLDAVDMAVIETDGEEITRLGPAEEKRLDPASRALIESAIADALRWEPGAPLPESFARAADVIADEHIAAADDFMRRHRLLPEDIDLIGLQGQTVLHAPPTPTRPVGRTVQLIDAEAVARGLGIAVAYDFRSDDLAEGGQGAPLAPAYHAALVQYSTLSTPTAVLNLGGVANVTLVGSDGALEAFDTGPANGMLDLLVQSRGAGRFDADGVLAGARQVDQGVLEAYLADPYFQRHGPKSLDRFDFALDPVSALSLEDAAATLTAFAAESVARGLRALPEIPLRLVVTGGGRQNPVLMQAIRERLPFPTLSAEDVHWRGDSIEAEAFAFLAARCLLGLPISFPRTTGVPAPMTGGRIVQP
ncbi:MAG TPA: anhydro-N-acetylmuramic acid kinase [Caulobacteraceae bacterium]|nr:anhydro-N-acetylmuramic acid kinase [Caulobacteraceae bacterium]